MIFKIKTSKKTMDIFQTISDSEQLQPFVLSKLAISLSIKSGKPLVEDDFHRDNNGLELNRQTITGDFDIIFRCLVEMNENKHLEDEDYFKNYLKAHLDRGAVILQQEQKYGVHFLAHLIEAEKGI